MATDYTYVSSTEVRCRTGAKGNRKGIRAYKNGKRMGCKGRFRNLNKWSETDTWGGDFPPQYGDTVWIPDSTNLLVDVDHVERLKAVVVEGSLIFKPDCPHRTFNAEYIIVNGGNLEIGTEAEPYCENLEITLWGTIDDPEVPIFGNKVLGVNGGTVDIHGCPRTPQWVELK